MIDARVIDADHIHGTRIFGNGGLTGGLPPDPGRETGVGVKPAGPAVPPVSP